MLGPPDELMAVAHLAFNGGNVGMADVLCREVVEQDAGIAAAWELQGRIAMAVGEHGMAEGHFRTALSIAPSFLPASEGLREAERRCTTEPAAGTDAWRRAQRDAGSDRGFLVLKAWGYGFCADVNQALGQLLLAEITGRTPVLAWGANSRYSSPGFANAWDQFFEPVSAVVPESLPSRAGIFPPKWNGQNLLHVPFNQWDGPWSRLVPIYFLNRPEDVAVVDFYSSAAGLRPWIPSTHPAHGLDVEGVYRYLVRKYLRILPAITAEIDAFRRERMAGRRFIAAHIRGSDKVTEVPTLADLNRGYPALIDAAITAEPDLNVFLLTDSSPTIEEYKARYGSRLLTTECIRTSGQVGLHHDPATASVRGRLGVEIIKDVALAAGCDRFIGLGSSAVSCMVMHMKDWAPGRCVLLGGNAHAAPLIGLYQ